MTDGRDKDGNLLPDKDRLTPFGKFLRASSLDELPEFFNILKGDMSFIGPRPLLVSYLPYYTERESLRHTVRPGLTGLAQVSGRNFIDWDRRLSKDVEYVEGLSFRMDLKVLFFKRKGRALPLGCGGGYEPVGGEFCTDPQGTAWSARKAGGRNKEGL